MLGKVKTTVVNITCKKNKEDHINVEIVRSKSPNSSYNEKNGRLKKMQVMISAEASVGETGCFIDLTDPHEIAWIQEKVEKEIKKRRLMRQSLLPKKNIKATFFWFGGCYLSLPSGTVEKNGGEGLESPFLAKLRLK
ncbi:hypothetical protein GCM10020331_103050 [Ectobacillus funiculus]